MSKMSLLFPARVKPLLYASILGVMSMETPLHAAVVANFSGGSGTTAPDQFQGTAGDGWSMGWISQNGSDGTTGFHVMTPSDPGYAPLNSGGNYLRIDYQRTEDAGSTIRAGIAREFDISGPEGIDLTRPYEIHFDFRLDQLTGFSSNTDQILFSTEDETTIRDSKGAAPWNLWIRGDQGFTVGNGNGTGGVSRVVLGLAVETGVVYSVSVYLNPADFSYDLTISTGTTTYRASDANQGNPLGFRTNTLASGANVLQARMINNEAGDHFVVSLDNVSVIPEPDTMALLGGASGILLLYWKRRASLLRR